MRLSAKDCMLHASCSASSGAAAAPVLPELSPIGGAHPAAADDWIALAFILREWGGSSGAEEAG